MTEPNWLGVDLVMAVHDEQIAAHGGLSGIRDAAMLESPLDLARNKWAYENADLPGLAAAYGYCIARNHPFADGNKRTSLLAIYTFLGLNSIDFIVAEADFAVIDRKSVV